MFKGFAALFVLAAHGAVGTGLTAYHVGWAYDPLRVIIQKCPNGGANSTDPLCHRCSALGYCGWRQGFTFYAFDHYVAGTTQFYVSHAENPKRSNVGPCPRGIHSPNFQDPDCIYCSPAGYCDWHYDFSFWAYDSQHTGTSPIYYASAAAPYGPQRSIIDSCPWGTHSIGMVDMACTCSAAGNCGWHHSSVFYAFTHQRTLVSTKLTQISFPTLDSIPPVPLKELAKRRYCNAAGVVQKFSSRTRKLTETTGTKACFHYEASHDFGGSMEQSAEISGSVPTIMSSGINIKNKAHWDIKMSAGGENCKENTVTTEETIVFPTVELQPYTSEDYMFAQFQGQIDNLPYHATLVQTFSDGSKMESSLSGSYSGVSFTEVDEAYINYETGVHSCYSLSELLSDQGINTEKPYTLAVSAAAGISALVCMTVACKHIQRRSVQLASDPLLA